MANIKLTLAYDGTEYKGWQKTKEGPSIEETLQSVLETILQHAVILSAASRTDAGVHASGQVVNFHSTRERIDLPKLLAAANKLLPEDIAVLSIEEAPLSFHATTLCQRKEYQYRFCTSPVQTPSERRYSWHYPYPLNLTLMREAAKKLLGEHDFKSLCNSKKNEIYSDTFRRIDEIEIGELPDNINFIKIVGNRFLYKMARNIAGLLVYVGRGVISLEEVGAILSSRNRERAGITAPAHGLTLSQVNYS